MPFVGAISDKLRRFFFTHAHLLEDRPIYVGCSGNFTIEQLISRRTERALIHSNDISLYSSVIGWALTGRTLPMQVTNPELQWIDDYLRRGPVESVATVLLVLEMLKYEKRRSLYAERMWTHYLADFQHLFDLTCARVAKAFGSTRIASYSTVDVHDFYPRPDGVSIGFLPTYVGGYERLFRRLEESIRWDTPRYEMLTAERREETVRRMTEGEFILYDDIERALPCIARVEMFGKKTVYIYSNLAVRSGLFRRRLKEKVLPYAMLMPDDEIPAGAEITVQPTEGAVVNHYRNLFLSKKIEPAAGDPNLLVFVGGRLFGCLVFQGYSLKGKVTDKSIYMLSDFVVPSTRYRRLAKLLVMASMTVEVRQHLEGILLKRLDGILTTAFTHKPVSMKYRGLYDLVKRGEGFLNYRGEFKPMTLKEVVPLWMKKYAKQ